MALAESGTLVAGAAARRGAVAAFNIITLEHAEAVISGAETAGSPVILQISENAVKYRQGGCSRWPAPRPNWPGRQPYRSPSTSTM